MRVRTSAYEFEGIRDTKFSPLQTVFLITKSCDQGIASQKQRWQCHGGRIFSSQLHNPVCRIYKDTDQEKYCIMSHLVKTTIESLIPLPEFFLDKYYTLNMRFIHSSVFHFLKHPSLFLPPPLFGLVLTLFVRVLPTFSDLPQGLPLPGCHHSHTPVL